MAVKDIINAIDDGKNVDATALFQQELADRIMQKLELRKPVVAKDWLNNLPIESLPKETEKEGE
jgi:hypothetical protein